MSKVCKCYFMLAHGLCTIKTYTQVKQSVLLKRTNTKMLKLFDSNDPTD